ncbi:MAG: nicotinate phosphoribosyltransferase [Nitrososphaerota archaeon]|nr:nicotinate phosphoribosyltransferase [Candidatus Bathyarchaeota archaeon]MDW8048074.1 nicotinate phosphoribosyltransferase [Nitrososphaerota archaeon]
MRRFYYADDEEIKNGKTTDIYFVRTKQILQAKKKDRVNVVAEVTAGGLPKGWEWAVLCGIEEVANLFEGCPVNVYAMPEGTIFFPHDYRGFREPVLYVEGPYGEFCLLETPMLGMLCQSTGVATQSARVRKVAGDKLVIAFGIRRMHPAIAPMLDRSSYIGGLDGVSSVIGAERIGIKPSGTMPHALIVALGSQIEAWRSFDELMPEDVPRICLVDTYLDEKVEAIMAADALKDRLYGVRLDTPMSRKGNFAEIVREVRWELDLRGYKHVKIFVSGGLDEESIRILRDAGAEAFGVGTSISNAPTVDFAMDIVEVEGRYAAKRGKLSGKKQVWRCKKCFADTVQPSSEQSPKCPRCGGLTYPMLKPLIKDGKIACELPTPQEIRGYVLEQLRSLPPL